MQKSNDILEYEKILIHTKLSCGKSLLELSKYNDVTLWWFVHPDFISFMCKYDALKCTNNSQYSVMKIKRQFIHFLRYMYLKFHHLLFYLLRHIIQLIGMFWRTNPKNSISKNKKILITGQDMEWRPTTGNMQCNSKNSDQFFKSIIDNLKDNNYLISTSPFVFPYFHSVSILIDKLKNWEVKHIPLDIFYSNKILQNQKKAMDNFKNIWELVKEDPVFKELTSFNNNGMHLHLVSKIESYFLYFFSFYINVIEMSSYLIEYEKPSLVLIECEYGSFQRPLLTAAKLKGVPTLAIQHGVIHESHSGYLYRKDDISSTGSVKFPYCPIPDKTAVYGTYHKDLLTNVSGYPENTVIVTGQPRYDILYNIDNIYSKEQFLIKYNINKNHKIILWTTQCHSVSEEENKNNFKAMFETLQNLKDLTLIIKQHPGEGNKYTKMIKAALKDYNLNVVITYKSSDTYEQLYVCDVMVTKNSTTAMEAVALNKPVIVLNLSGEPDVVGYVTEGVALGVYNEKDLKPTIEKLLKDDSTLAEKRDQYIEKYLYKIDGKSTERMVQLIEKTLDEWDK